MRIKIYFETSGKNLLISEVDSFSKANQVMREKIKEINFKSYYTRINFETEKRIWIDFGSHTKFFVFELEDSDITFEKLFKDSTYITTLKIILEKFIDKRLYSIYSFREEAFCLEEYGDNYIIYLGERGQKHNIEIYSDAIDACKKMISKLSESDEEENKILSAFMEEIK